MIVKKTVDKSIFRGCAKYFADTEIRCVAHAIIPMQMIRLTTSTSKTDITWDEGVCTA